MRAASTARTLLPWTRTFVLGPSFVLPLCTWLLHPCTVLSHSSLCFARAAPASTAAPSTHPCLHTQSHASSASGSVLLWLHLEVEGSRAMTAVITRAAADLSTPTVAKPCTGGACLAPSSCVAHRSCPLSLLTLTKPCTGGACLALSSCVAPRSCPL